jgi:hypothetical protein
MALKTAPHLNAAARCILANAGDARRALTGALWPDAVVVADRLAATPQALRDVPADWVPHVLALCPDDVVTAAAAKDRRVATQTAARALLGDASAPGPVQTTPEAAVTSWRRSRVPRSRAEAVLKMAAARVPASHEVWGEVHDEVCGPPNPPDHIPQLSAYSNELNLPQAVSSLPADLLAAVMGHAAAWDTVHLAMLSLCPTDAVAYTLAAHPKPAARNLRGALTQLGAQRGRTAALSPSALVAFAEIGGVTAIANLRAVNAAAVLTHAPKAYLAVAALPGAGLPDALAAIATAFDDPTVTSGAAFGWGSLKAVPSPEAAATLLAAFADHPARRQAVACLCGPDAISGVLAAASTDEQAAWAASAPEHQVRSLLEGRGHQPTDAKAVAVLLDHRPGLVGELLGGRTWWRIDAAVAGQVADSLHRRLGDDPQLWRVALDLAADATLPEALAAAVAVAGEA